MSYSVKGNSTASRLRKFFADNPVEELTYADIGEKFDLTATQSRDVVRELRKQGILESSYLVRLTPAGRVAMRAKAATHE